MSVQGVASMRPVDSRIVSSSTAAAVIGGAQITGYGNLRVTKEPSSLFSDPMDGAVIDTTNRWNAAAVTGGMTVTQSNGAQIITTNTTNSASAYIDSQPSFTPIGINFLAFGSIIKLEAQAANLFALNQHRFWGHGDRPVAFDTTTPLKNAIGFAIDIDGQLRCVVCDNGTLVFSQHLSLLGANLNTLVTPSTGFARFGMAIRADLVLFYVGTTEYPAAAFSVSSASFILPDVQTLPIRFAAVNTPAGVVEASTFQYSAVGLGDTGSNGQQLSDGVYPWRKAVVSAAGNLSTTGLDTFITGQAAQTASGQNIVLATAGTGWTDALALGARSIAIQTIPTGTLSSGVVTFEGSHDGTTAVAIPLYDTASLTANPVTTISPVTSTNRYMQGAVPYRYFRARISTVLGGGGSIQALTRFNTEPYNPVIRTITQGTAANLLCTATIGSGTVTTVTTLSNGQAAHGASITGSPHRIAGRALTANYTPVATGQVADFAATLVGAQIEKPFSIPEAEYVGIDSITNSATAVQIKALTASNKIYSTGIVLAHATLGAAMEITLRSTPIISTTATIASNTLVMSATYNWKVGDLVYVTASGVTGLTAANYYYLLTVSAASLTFSATRGGSTLVISGTTVNATLSKIMFRTQLQTTALPLTDLSFVNPLDGGTGLAIEMCTPTAQTGRIDFNVKGYVAP